MMGIFRKLRTAIFGKRRPQWRCQKCGGKWFGVRRSSMGNPNSLICCESCGWTEVQERKKQASKE